MSTIQPVVIAGCAFRPDPPVADGDARLELAGALVGVAFGPGAAGWASALPLTPLAMVLSNVVVRAAHARPATGRREVTV